ncbi:MAG: nucleotidyltransferase [Saprospiraceae bacterium]|nr:nucleotidyltransferase [Saprospiraceae bacterium]
MQPTLLILAAGIGSRYGGLKQVDGMGPGGEAIIEYSAFDALRAGFGKIVFVIRRDIETEFRERVGSRIEPHIPVEYAFQEMDTALDWLAVRPQRVKPWGTGHAILSARQYLTEPFAAINADDFYGAEAFQTLADFLKNDCSASEYALVAYRLANTLSENGSVSRGVCVVSPDGYLSEVTERTKIERFAEGIFHTFDDGSRLALPDETLVSMNFWGFHPAILEEIDRQFREFVDRNAEQPKAEFYIPSVVSAMIHSGKAKVKTLSSESAWYGVTYPGDKDTVQAALAELTRQGVYKKPLW